MNASKENAKKARENLIGLEGLLNDETVNEEFVFIENFLIAAERKLPSEASYLRENQNRLNKRKRTKLADG